ncbi:uncharacterized protein E0L32_007560 [Thyridium curvatum]|uniref:Catechol dioxygenase n=1 Tax=Thyridium curvatum TaxID=1093900 RepID=A0A507AVS3_9PEZI|nr:uncharacterized protein E0L32_007560 [Thyridium curvatum]TPX11823.1 hypothetical protein E0L32_007560 [Thyridium curvatum]
MATNGQKEEGLGQEFTKQVIDSFGPKTDPRLREIMASFTQHIHDFIRETQLTTDEWMTAVKMINWSGQMSNEKRNEGQLMCDIIGIESLVDDITHRKLAKEGHTGTNSAILGPFWRADTPWRENGTTITFDTPKDAQVSFLYGQITDSHTGKPIPNASVELWQASTNGLYEQQDDKQVEHNLRGKFRTDAEGRYSCYCIRPTPYPVPNDGPSGQILEMLDRHPYRPAHIHFMVIAEGYQTLVTQIFDSGSDYVDNDSVFAVKDGLTVDFVPRKGDPQADWQLEYNISIGPA